MFCSFPESSTTLKHLLKSLLFPKSKLITTASFHAWTPTHNPIPSYAKSKPTFSCASLLLAVLLFTRSSFSCCSFSKVASKGNTCSCASWKAVGESPFYFLVLLKINNFSSCKNSYVLFFFNVCWKKWCENVLIKFWKFPKICNSGTGQTFLNTSSLPALQTMLNITRFVFPPGQHI